MRYDDQDRRSSNVEDRRSQGGRGFRFPGGLGGRGGGVRIPIGGRGGFSLTTLLILGAIMLFFGINPLDVLMNGGGSPGRSGFEIPQLPNSEQADRSRPRSGVDIPGLPGSSQKQATSDDEMKVFVERVLADTEDVWTQVFRSFGKDYPQPRLVLFRGNTPTSCGMGQAAMGPFYCPLDEKIYIDLAFYDQLKRQFSAPGDFAQAYVIAHEVGHHIQKALGIADKVQAAKQQRSREEGNRLQVRMELQADCLAGVWAARNDQLKQRLEPGDIEEGLNAAKQIGDDMIQRRQQGYVVPDAFTHGSAAQRQRWFKLGFKDGQIQACQPAFELGYEQL
ncbi:MAG: metalloprotease [Alphaproteobacteria bacterium BRH_c36]|nr:MAG: metalloprotease [Alphaproteobacteria bacterium BRH_c36]KUO69601.1 MAG: metalloprotease [Alphaproteobacteria bacterium BRH_c36]